MAKTGGYTISDIYQGGASSLKPGYGTLFTGYRDSVGNIGSGTDARTANVLKEVSDKISTGAKTIELNQVFPEVFNSIPNEQLKEVRKISELTGVDMTFHAPTVGLDPSGMDKQGHFSESQRESVERSMINVIDRVQEVKPKGGLPITFHAAEGVPETYPDKSPEEDKAVYVVNTDSNALAKLPLKKREFTGGEIPDVKNELKKINKDSWTQNLQNLAYYADYGENLIRNSETMKKLIGGEEKAGKQLTDIEKESLRTYDRGVAHLQDSYRRLGDFFETAYKHASNDDKKKLIEFRDSAKDKIAMIEKNGFNPENVENLREVVDTGFNVLSKMQNAPEMFKPVNEFVEEKATKTFGNVAFHAYKKFGSKAPVICIENSYAGGAFSTGEGLKKVVEKSKEEFVNKAVSEGISKSEAKKVADKIIGATWDTGRINTLRKHGFTKEEIIKESEKIAPLVKHVHLSDNFGMESTEIPMGMGNVPVKEIMERLGKEGFEGKKVLEAMHWWQHFKSSPMQQTFEAFGSPIYADGVGPYWNQAVGLQQGYYSGYGMMLPQSNYQMFGAGFSQLPTELGGQMQGAQGSRMSGRGME